jgi:tetratricopeptide (TPR) repeat protein
MGHNLLGVNKKLYFCTLKIKRPMAKKKNENMLDAEEILSKSESFVKNNSKILIGIVVLLIGGAIAIWWWTSSAAEEEIESQQVVWKPEYYFEIDSFAMSLENNAQGYGFKHIAAEYDGTSGGKLANYYMGISYLNMGQFQAAINALKKVDFNDNMVSSVALGAIGDCYMELGDTKKAANYYEKAAKNSTNNFTTPHYLKKAGLAQEDLNNFSKAAKHYQKIVDDFPFFTDKSLVEKYLARAKNARG